MHRREPWKLEMDAGQAAHAHPQTRHMHRWDSCEQVLKNGLIRIYRMEVGSSGEGRHRCDSIAAADVEHVALHGSCMEHAPHRQIIEQWTHSICRGAGEREPSEIGCQMALNHCRVIAHAALPPV